MLAYEYGADSSLHLREKDLPQAADGEVTIDVVAAGICGTDLKIARGEHRLFPAGTVRVPGHESVGRIRENRSGRADLEPGTPVAIAPNIACGQCPPCRKDLGPLCEDYTSVGLTFDGGFAEVVRVTARGVAGGNVLPLPPGLDMVTAAMIEPVAAVVRGLRPLRLTSADTVLVCGAGPIGLTAVVLAKQAGVRRIIVSQTSAARRELAREYGADETIDPRAEDLVEKVFELTDGIGAEVVIAATPVHQVFTDAVRAAAKGGRVNFFAGLPSGKGEVTVDANLIHYRELLVTGSTANTAADCAEAMAIVAKAPEAFAALVTHQVPLREADRAFELAKSGEALKVLLEPQA
ncbi:zinc-binding dehydrogenase [Ruania halotolerans]|uniref:zinc-binding dehydrogenase n=1 Tax=Ruania halotolerans TaxID=2897773 RepID=UPI001E3C355C|nr:alcohol dehydrogenase catalytic domain-containing protein [Ruania halotolerans]UFU06508.1 alcohol dehydrogenase catalytic domain-containing protein [Ruania halotolerans]